MPVLMPLAKLDPNRTPSIMEEFLSALDDLIVETEGLSVIELVGALELAKNDIIAGLAVAELMTEDGEEATA
jgi:hypothetical protein